MRFIRMASGPRYQVLLNEEEHSQVTQANGNTNVEASVPADTEPTTVAQNVVSTTEAPDSPPPYDGNNSNEQTENYASEPPPLYTDVVKLPSYNEINDNTNEERDYDDESGNRSVFWFWLYGSQDTNDDNTGSYVGFIFAFLISFIFNWIGFLISYCMTTDLSSHYGAVSGFGLSMVKWGYLMKHSNWPKVQENPWFFYLFVLFGWIVFLRGIIGYMSLHHFQRRSRREQNDGLFI